MADRQTRSAYWQGLRAGLPFMLVVVPFGLLFGVVANQAGWTLTQNLMMSVMVIAGASQFAALQLLTENAPTLIVIATALAVNLRLAMYSASIAPHIGTAPLWQRALAAYFLVDQTYGAAIARYELQPTMSVPQRIAYFFGAATPVCGPWYLATVIGQQAGSAIPPALALDFAVPITFIALVAPMLRTLPHVVAAFVSVVASLALSWIPYNLWLIIAAGLAMAAGAGTEIWQERRR
jgi:predicted branched-subunit amino acid permease